MEIFDKSTHARIHSIETFGTVDGPGIRFVVFMQGCHLRCKYCQNRDTWDCNSGKIVTLDELYNHVLRYEDYFKLSNGGVTVTGGEPLLQTKFLINFFTKLKQRNIHTTIDTSGMFDINEEIKALLKLTDLVLLDIKHINEEKAKQLVGLSNKKELEFAKYLSDNDIPIWIRQVIVPGITDNEEDLITLRDFIKSLKTVKKIELLPYHDIGKFKWEALNLNYELKDIKTATDEDIKRVKKILEID